MNHKVTESLRSSEQQFKVQSSLSAIGYWLSAILRFLCFLLFKEIRVHLCPSVVFFCFLTLSLAPSLAQKPTDSSVKTLSPAEGDREAQTLINQILSQRPEQTFTNALLKIRNHDGAERKILVRFQTTITPTNWSATYEASPSPPQEERRLSVYKAIITHSPSQPNQYVVYEAGNTPKTISPDRTNIPFANSDFSLADLGFEFLHWPKQRITKKEMYSSRYCAVLESTNPHPTKDACARVRSWITTEPPLAPVRAEAYDASGKRIKVFDVKGVERVKGHFQVDSVEMRSLQNGSRTVMEFDLGGE